MLSSFLLIFINDFRSFLQIGVGKTANFNLPGTLKTGSYIMRHELIAIHNAVKLGREEFYMGCMQLNVTNTAGNVVEPDSFVAFPGAYKDSDPGLFMPTVSYILLSIPTHK